MEDFSKPVSPYRGRGRGSYVPRTIFNPAADVLAGIEYVEGTFKERRDKVNLFQQQAEQRRIDMQKLVNDTQRIDQTDTMAKMTDQFSNMVTDIYKADIASFDGDRSDYLNKANNAQKVIGDFGKVIGTVNELSNKYLDMNPAEQKKMVLRNQFIGENGDKRKAYMDFLNDPSKMNIRIQGSDIIITNDGQDLFNGTQLLNSVKDGNNLIEYANDYTEQIGAASKDAMSGIKNLVVAKQYEGMSNDGSRVYTTAKNDYLGAADQYRKNLENSDKIDALLNESTFQRYIDGDENYNSQKHDAATKEAIIEQLIIKEFPMYKEELKKGKLVRSAIGNKKVVSKLATKKAEEEKEEEAPETVTYTEILKPAETLKSLLQNPNQGTRSKELVTEENKMRFEALSDSEKKAKKALETSLNNRFFGQNFGTQSEPVIIAKGEIAVNNDGELMYFPKYNKTTKGVTDLATIESYNNGIPLTEDFLFRFEKKLNKVIGEDVKLASKYPVIKNQNDFYSQEIGTTVQYNGKLYVIAGNANSRSLILKK